MSDVPIKKEHEGELKNLQQLVNERWDKLCAGDEHPVTALDKFIGFEEDMAQAGLVLQSACKRFE